MDIHLNFLDTRRVEVIAGRKFGLAKLNDDDDWEISPNVEEHTENIMKQLKGAEVIIVSSEPEEDKPRKKSKKNS